MHQVGFRLLPQKVFYIALAFTAVVVRGMLINQLNAGFKHYTPAKAYALSSRIVAL